MHGHSVFLSLLPHCRFAGPSSEVQVKNETKVLETQSPELSFPSVSSYAPSLQIPKPGMVSALSSAGYTEFSRVL